MYADAHTVIAHFRQGDGKIQSLDEHQQGTALLAETFAHPLRSAEWIRAAALLHDCGKADSLFQGYIRRENAMDDSAYDEGRVNHSTAGARLAVDFYGNFAGRVLAYLIAGHHAGLADYYATETGCGSLQHRLEEGKDNVARIRSYTDALSHALPPLTRPPSFLTGRPEDFHLWIRMLYSCLVDADFLDTEAFMQPDKPAMRLGYRPLAELGIKFDAYMDKKSQTAPKTAVNAIRQEILATCRATAKQAPGLYTLTVPTGGGKTLSGMAFALGHAAHHKKRRIIYVIPYTSIIEQTANTLKEIFGETNVVEHHSNMEPERETQRSRLASENWDAPIIVTTNVQFFESLYAAKSSRCRKLHNIADSVVILDEAQLLPPDLLTPCVAVMNQLVRNYGVTMVLSTATQPALPGLSTPTEIIPPGMNLYGRLKRTDIRMPTDIHAPLDWPSLAGQLQQHDCVLCIVNTRRDCHELHRIMPADTIHLSGLMCGAHRSHVIANIKQALEHKQPIRVISTQLVESGVDIDFPVVYRALAGLDSIAQAAGRCNREGRLNDDGKLGEVHVIVPPRPAPPGLLRKGEDTMKELHAGDMDPQQPESYRRYFELFYAKVNNTGLQFKDWLVKNVNPTLAFQFRTAAANFKLIAETQQPVIVRYGESDSLIARLRLGGSSRDLMRQLQRYTVNLPTRVAARLTADGLLEDLSDGIFVQTMPGAYRKDIGFDVFKESLPEADLIL
jgi:CRISPR-associated endonuclease/helicase Cas3